MPIITVVQQLDPQLGSHFSVFCPKLLAYCLQVWAGLKNAFRSLLLRAIFTVTVGWVGKTQSLQMFRKVTWMSLCACTMCRVGELSYLSDTEKAALQELKQAYRQENQPLLLPDACHHSTPLLPSSSSFLPLSVERSSQSSREDFSGCESRYGMCGDCCSSVVEIACVDWAVK